MKQIRLNALDMNCMGCTPGIWTHPDDQTSGYLTLDYWIEMAKLLEHGCFDSIFIADVLGMYDVYGGNSDAAFVHAVEFPVNDPLLLVSAMAAATEHLCFGITGNTCYEPPFSFARRMSTLDHATRGRMAWNVVTGYLGSAARGFGMPDQLPHDERYQLAAEYMEIVYRLWEESWEDDAVRRDKISGIFADPSKTHKIKHNGKYFQIDAYHLCEPSPQRTPVIFQAGASKAGRAFAAEHSECMFISGFTPQAVAATVADIRAQAIGFGRDPGDIVIYTAMSAIVAETDEAAQARYADYKKHVNLEATLTLFSGYTGVDLSKADLDAPYTYLESNAIQTFVEGFTIADPDKIWTLREVAEFLGTGGFAPNMVGSPQTIADDLETWMEQTGIDGFNMIYSVSPYDVEQFVNLVVPELQKRGRHQTSYRQGTMREKLYGIDDPRHARNHPREKYRKAPRAGSNI